MSASWVWGFPGLTLPRALARIPTSATLGMVWASDGCGWTGAEKPPYLKEGVATEKFRPKPKDDGHAIIR